MASPKESRERKTLQPWVTQAFEVRSWVCWKVEDAYRPGLPDFVVKSPTGRVSWLEIKWATQMGVVPFHLTKEQYVHLKQWGEGAFVLVACPLIDKIYLVPIEALETARQTLSIHEVDRLPGRQSCSFERRAMGKMLRWHLT